MIRWLLIALFIYLVYRLIMGPKKKNNRRSGIRFQFKNYQNQGNSSDQNRSKKSRFDEIEEAEYEDITEKEKKNIENQ